MIINNMNVSLTFSFQLVDKNRLKPNGKVFSKVYNDKSKLLSYLVGDSHYTGTSVKPVNLVNAFGKIVKDSVKVFKADSKRRNNKVKISLKDDNSVYVFVTVMI